MLRVEIEIEELGREGSQRKLDIKARQLCGLNGLQPTDAEARWSARIMTKVREIVIDDQEVVKAEDSKTGEIVKDSREG